MIVRFASFSALALFVAAGCAAKSTSTDSSNGTLGSTEDALSSDNTETQESEDGAEEAEDGLSGASASDPGTPAEGADADAIDAKIKTNPGLFFTPAGCIVSTRVSAGVWNHVFTNCTGPAGKRTYNGTIKSTWTVSAGHLEVKHESTSFEIKGPNVDATISGSRDVNYTKAGTLITKTRVGSWSGTATKNANGKSEAWSHTANFTSTWDAATKCYTRDGEVDNTLGNREFGRKISGFKVCGGIFACPQSGELELDRKDGTVKITITFLGGSNIEVVGAKGNKAERKLICIGG